MKAFINGETILSADKRTVRLSPEMYEIIPTCKGSYNIIASRLFNLSYADYLRFVRDKYHATLRGKEGYSYFYFTNSADCDALVRELNKRWDTVMKMWKEKGII